MALSLPTPPRRCIYGGGGKSTDIPISHQRVLGMLKSPQDLGELGAEACSAGLAQHRKRVAALCAGLWKIKFRSLRLHGPCQASLTTQVWIPRSTLIPAGHAGEMTVETGESSKSCVIEKTLSHAGGKEKTQNQSCLLTSRGPSGIAHPPPSHIHTDTSTKTQHKHTHTQVCTHT